MTVPVPAASGARRGCCGCRSGGRIRCRCRCRCRGCADKTTDRQVKHYPTLPGGFWATSTTIFTEDEPRGRTSWCRRR